MSKHTVFSEKIKKHFSRYEYEIILFTFLILRFVFKNILSYKEYFSAKPVFHLSDSISIVFGSVVVLLICLFISHLFGKLIRANGPDNEKPVIMIVALFFSCPATLPFLFDADSISGTNMLYPFALFSISILLVTRPWLKWVVPFICLAFFIPALYSQNILFLSMREWSPLYVPLLLMFLYLEMMVKQIKPESNKKSKGNGNPNAASVFDISLILSVGAYIYSIYKGSSFKETAFNTEQKFDVYFLACLIIISPALSIISTVIYKAVANRYPSTIIAVFLATPLLLLLITQNNYYGLWVPFLIVSLFILVFYSIWHKNPAMLTAVRTVGDYLSAHSFVFYIVLIAMASTTNVSSNYLSEAFQKIFNSIPY